MYRKNEKAFFFNPNEKIFKVKFLFVLSQSVKVTAIVVWNDFIMTIFPKNAFHLCIPDVEVKFNKNIL